MYCSANVCSCVIIMMASLTFPFACFGQSQRLCNYLHTITLWFDHSFISETIKIWNSLSSSVVDCYTLNICYHYTYTCTNIRVVQVLYS